MHTALHWEDRHAGPSAVVPLQHHTPHDRVKPPDPDLSHPARSHHHDSTNAWGTGLAMPAIELHLALVTSKKKPARGRGARHVRHSTSSHGSVSIVAIGKDGNASPHPKVPSEHPTPPPAIFASESDLGP